MANEIVKAALDGAKITIESDCWPLRRRAQGIHISMTKQTWNGVRTMNREIKFGENQYNVTLVNVGNPHCVIFCDKVDETDIEALGQAVLDSGFFPQGVFVECVRVVNNVTVKMRVWEKRNGETWSCGTAAAASAVASITCGYCSGNEIITVKLKGGDLFVKLNGDGEIELDGTVRQSFEGLIEI